MPQTVTNGPDSYFPFITVSLDGGKFEYEYVGVGFCFNVNPERNYSTIALSSFCIKIRQLSKLSSSIISICVHKKKLI